MDTICSIDEWQRPLDKVPTYKTSSRIYSDICAKYSDGTRNGHENNITNAKLLACERSDLALIWSHLKLLNGSERAKMTETEPRRRSRRIRELEASQTVDYDEQIDGNDYEEEEEYDEQPVMKKRKTTQKKNRKTGKTAKPVATGSDAYAQLREEFEENYLFQAMVDPEVSIAELATDWVDLYKTDKDLAKRDLINMILNAVGCFTRIEEHDVSNNESASETVGEIQTFFKRQNVHEFYLLSKKPEYKHLLKNFTHFITQMIQTCDEKGLLYENIAIAEEDEEIEEPEGTNVIEDMLIWLSSFSVSRVRSLRYIATLSLFTMETTLCKTTEKNTASLEKFKHQLSLEQGKKQSTAVKKRVAQIEENVELYTNQASILDNFIQDIVNTTFIHRFKDVDHHIRVEAMNALGDWMMIYSEMFYKVTYLKYLGWVLSDENPSVRLQVIKTLVRLLKHNVVVSGLRQFVERFKDRIVEMTLHDIDVHVKNNAVILLTEINRIGFLGDEEISKVSSLIFSDVNLKVQPLVATFISQVEIDRTDDLVEGHAALIDMEQESFSQDLNELIKYKNLISLLCSAHGCMEPSSKNDTGVSPFATTGKLLASTKRYANSWSSLIDYYTLDTSDIDDLDESLSNLVKLNSKEKFSLLSLTHGSLIAFKDSKASDEDCLELISKFPTLLKVSELSTAELATFIQIFMLFPVDFFQSHNQTDIYLSCFKSLAKFFKNNLLETIQTEYILLLKSLPTSQESTIITEVSSLFQDLVKELMAEFTNLITNKKFEFNEDSASQLQDDIFLKLLILGTNFNISFVLPVFEQLRDSIFTVLPDSGVESSSTSLQRALESLFKLFLSGSSWKLNRLLQSNEVYDVEVELKFIPDLLHEGCEIIREVRYPLKFRSEVASTIMDFFTILKNFIVTYNESKRDNLSHFTRFTELSLSSLQFSDATLGAFTDIFLRKEALFASVLDVMLEREDDEDITYNSMKCSPDADKWEIERDLVVFTAKLMRLYKLKLLTQDNVKRFALNCELLGDLFQGIVQLDEEEDDEIEEDDDVPNTQLE